MIMGGEYSMRVWMKPDVMAQYKLIPSDITGVLAEQNIESATVHSVKTRTETYQYTMKYKGRLITPEEFGDIVIRSTDNGEVLKLKDIAEIQLGQDSYAYHGGMDRSSGRFVHGVSDGGLQCDRSKPEHWINSLKKP